MKREAIESILVSIFTIYLFFYSYVTGVFVVYSARLYPASYQFLFILLPYVIFPFLVFFRKNSIINRIYAYFLFIGLVTFIILLFTYIVYPLIEVLVLFTLAFYTDIIDITYFRKDRKLFYRGAAFILILFIMLFISRFLAITVPIEPTKIVVDSIYADFPSSKVPFFFYYGIIMRVNYLDFTMGIQSIILYIILAALLTENYFLIFGIVKGGTGEIRKEKNRKGNNAKDLISPTISGGISVLSCQCEGLTATLPTVAAVIATTVSTALLSESIALLLFSNFMLTVFLTKRSRLKIVSNIKDIRNSNVFPLLAIFFIIITPVAETIGIAFHLEFTSLLFFYGINILMFVAGIFLVYVLTKIGIKPTIINNKIKITLVIVASLLMFIWFIPSIAYYAYTYYTFYLLMNIFSLVSGLITYTVYINLYQLKRAYVEFNSMMFSMTALIIFYISLINVTTLYPLYGVTQQIYFSAILWGVALPFMWLSTIDTMYQYSIPEEPYIIKNKKRNPKTFNE